jgi:hypothetical protein
LPCDGLNPRHGSGGHCLLLLISVPLSRLLQLFFGQWSME